MKARRRVCRPREVFLSHSSRDRRVAMRIADLLRRHGIPVWFSRTHLRGAQQWHDEIGVALNRCDWFIVLLSPSAMGSRWVKYELLFALDSDRYENKVLPLKIDPCDPAQLSWTLKNFQIVDFTRSFAKGSRALLRTWRMRLQPKEIIKRQSVPRRLRGS
jgi:hypothetical protein